LNTRGESTDGWRKHHNEELYVLYPSPNTIKLINPYRTNVENRVSS